MKKIHRYQGFTLIELLISIAIIVILSGMSFAYFTAGPNGGDVTNTAKQMSVLLRQAQTQSVQEYQGASWGIRFANGVGSSSSTFYALFSGSYSTTSVTGYYPLPRGVAFTTGTVPLGSSTDVIFSLVSGSTASTSVGIYMVSQPSISSTIRISPSGNVAY